MRKIISFGASCAAGAALLVCSFATPVSAQSAFWHGVRSTSWQGGISGGTSNWYSEAPASGDPRDVPSNVANFAPGAVRTEVVLENETTIRTMRFFLSVEEYEFTLQGQNLLLTGTGIVNDATSTPRFIVDSLAEMRFQGSAKIVGTGAFDSANIQTFVTGKVFFEGSSDGGDALLTNNDSGRTTFTDESTARNMSISNQGADSRTEFLIRANGGRAQFTNAGGLLDFSKTKGVNGDNAITGGSITNSGDLKLGGNTLTLFNRLTLQLGGTLTVESDRKKIGNIIVTKNAKIAGSLVVDGTGPKGKRHVLVRGGTSRTGKFANVQFSADLKARNARIAYQGNEVVMLLD